MHDAANLFVSAKRPKRMVVRLTRMSKNYALTPEELKSLEEIARGILHAPIPEHHAKTLMKERLIYSLLGSYRLTADGREYLRNVKS